MNAVERVLEYTELDPEEDMKKYPERIENCYERGVISFDNVYLGYYLDSRVIIGMYFEKFTLFNPSKNSADSTFQLIKPL